MATELQVFVQVTVNAPLVWVSLVLITRNRYTRVNENAALGKLR